MVHFLFKSRPAFSDILRVNSYQSRFHTVSPFSVSFQITVTIILEGNNYVKSGEYKNVIAENIVRNDSVYDLA